jgi:hypothetical protein
MISNGAAAPEWPDGTTQASTHNGDPSGDIRNEGIKYVEYESAGQYKIHLQDRYAYLAYVHATAEDDLDAFCIWEDEDVDSGSDPYVTIQFSDGTAAEEVTDGKKIYGYIDLYNKKNS